LRRPDHVRQHHGNADYAIGDRGVGAAVIYLISQSFDFRRQLTSTCVRRDIGCE
jgi:hypothetical protein